MADNDFGVRTTQWSKWNKDGRKAYNKMRRLGFTHETGVAEADIVTLKSEIDRKNHKRGLLEKITDAVEDVAEVVDTVEDVVGVVTPLVPVAEMVVKTVKRTRRSRKDS